MLKRLSIVAIGALLVAVIAPSAFAAATLNLELQYVQSVTSANAALTYSVPLTNGGTIPAGMVDPTDRHRFAYLFTITGQASDESLQGIQSKVVRTGWDIALNYATVAIGTVGPLSNPTHDPDSTFGDNPSPRALYSLVADSGSSVSDYETLRAVADANNEWYAPHNFNPGESGATYLGRLTFNLALPSTPGVYTLVLEADNPAGGNFSTWLGGGAFDDEGTATATVYPNSSINSSTFTITVVPEPATLVLLGLGAPALALIARRRMRRDVS